MQKKLPETNKFFRGQTLLSLLIALPVFAILAHAIFTLTISSFRLISFSRSRIAARHLTQERVELIRNMSYDDVGTVGGIPPGTLSQSEDALINGLNYTTKTSVIYVDDPFDGQAPADLLPTDYKRVRVEVSWEGSARSGNNPVVLVTDVTPRGVETSVGGGTLSILVFDANAIPIVQASVHILADSLDPIVDLTLETNENGRVVLPGTPICNSCYKITASKEDYNTEQTYSTAEVANPNKPNASVIEGELTELSFAIDKVSTLDIETVSSREDDFDALGNISFRLRGQKTIGTDVSDLPVYKFDQEFASNSSGSIALEDVEWDNYDILLPLSGGYDLSGSNPLLPMSVLPNTTYNLALSLSSHTNYSLLLTFTDPTDTPIASVSATLSDGGSFEETKFSGEENDPDFGQAFFSNLFELTYDLNATASGYLDYNSTVSVSGTSKEKVRLSPE